MPGPIDPRKPQQPQMLDTGYGPLPMEFLPGNMGDFSFGGRPALPEVAPPSLEMKHRQMMKQGLPMPQPLPMPGAGPMNNPLGLEGTANQPMNLPERPQIQSAYDPTSTVPFSMSGDWDAVRKEVPGMVQKWGQEQAQRDAAMEALWAQQRNNGGSMDDQLLQAANRRAGRDPYAHEYAAAGQRYNQANTLPLQLQQKQAEFNQGQGQAVQGAQTQLHPAVQALLGITATQKALPQQLEAAGRINAARLGAQGDVQAAQTKSAADLALGQQKMLPDVLGLLGGARERSLKYGSGTDSDFQPFDAQNAQYEQALQAIAQMLMQRLKQQGSF